MKKTAGLHQSKQKKISLICLQPRLLQHHLFTAFSNPGKPPLSPTRAHLLCLFSQNDSFQKKQLLYLAKAFQKTTGHSMAQENSQPNHNFEEHRLSHNQVLDTQDHILYRLFCVRTTDFVTNCKSDKISR